MTILDDTLPPIVLTILAKYGKALTFTSYASSTYDRTTGAVTNTGPSSFSVLCSPPAPYDVRYINGDVIRATDTFTIVPALFVPTLAMLVSFDGDQYKIESIKKLYSGENILAYRIQLRK